MRITFAALALALTAEAARLDTSACQKGHLAQSDAKGEGEFALLDWMTTPSFTCAAPKPAVIQQHLPPQVAQHVVPHVTSAATTIAAKKEDSAKSAQKKIEEANKAADAIKKAAVDQVSATKDAVDKNKKVQDAKAAAKKVKK